MIWIVPQTLLRMLWFVAPVQEQLRCEPKIHSRAKRSTLTVAHNPALNGPCNNQPKRSFLRMEERNGGNRTATKRTDFGTKPHRHDSLLTLLRNSLKAVVAWPSDYRLSMLERLGALRTNPAIIGPTIHLPALKSTSMPGHNACT